MGEIAEAILEGAMCQTCGEFFEDGEVGFPRTCAACRQEDRIAHSLAHPSEKVKCPKCGKRVKAVGLADHVRDVHSERSDL